MGYTNGWAEMGMKNLCLGLICLICLCPATANAQDCSPGGLQRKIDDVEHELRAKMGVPVRLHRVEELEDQIFTPKVSASADEARVHLYQVETRTFYWDRGVLLEISGGGGKYSSYVAISCDGSHVYRLGGFSEAEADFTRLLREQDVIALSGTSQSVEKRAFFCANALYEVSSSMWLLDEDKLRLDLAGHFLDVGKDDAFALADRWWKSYRASHPEFKARTTITGPPSTGSTPGDFIVAVPYLWAPLEGSSDPQIRELRIQIKADGSCHRLESH